MTKNNIIIDGELIEFSTEDKMLGIKIARTGIGRHIEEITNKGKGALAELYRFRNLSPSIKIHLVKAFIISILHYPPVPLITASKSSIAKLQKIRNRGLRYALNGRHPHTRNTIELHQIAKIEHKLRPTPKDREGL